MYCVQCGVRLEEGVARCPLCNRQVILSETPISNKPQSYSDRFPQECRHARLTFLGFLTTLMAVAGFVSFIVCLKTQGQVAWSGYVMLGLVLAWIIFVLPGFFKKSNPLVFIALDTLAVGGYLLYINASLGHHWFLSFAFPVTLLVGGLLLVAVCLYRNIKGGRLYITGGLLIALGNLLMLIEFFQHITFKTPMFMWSLYCVGVFSLMGLFLIIAALIPPLKSYIERKYFI